MKDNKKDNPKSRSNWQQSFTHQKTPNRVAPRLGGHQKNKGTMGVRKGAR
jgi:hypothetical protein